MSRPSAGWPAHRHSVIANRPNTHRKQVRALIAKPMAPEPSICPGTPRRCWSRALPADSAGRAPLQGARRESLSPGAGQTSPQIPATAPTTGPARRLRLGLVRAETANRRHRIGAVPPQPGFFAVGHPQNPFITQAESGTRAAGFPTQQYNHSFYAPQRCAIAWRAIHRMWETTPVADFAGLQRDRRLESPPTVYGWFSPVCPPLAAAPVRPVG